MSVINKMKPAVSETATLFLHLKGEVKRDKKMPSLARKAKQQFNTSINSMSNPLKQEKAL